MEFDHFPPQIPPDYSERRWREEGDRRSAVLANVVSSWERHYRIKAHDAAYLDLPTHGLDLSPLSPDEVVNLERSVTAGSSPTEVATTDQGVMDLRPRLDWTLDHLPALDPPRGAAILTAFVASPLPADRAGAARDGLVTLTQFDHDTGVSLWDRLMRDTDKPVRDAGRALMDKVLAEHRMKPTPRTLPRKGSGFYALDRVSEKQLRELTGLSREDARALLESYAYAENGEGIHDLGAIALNKLAKPE